MKPSKLLSFMGGSCALKSLRGETDARMRRAKHFRKEHYKMYHVRAKKSRKNIVFREKRAERRSGATHHLSERRMGGLWPLRLLPLAQMLIVFNFFRTSAKSCLKKQIIRSILYAYDPKSEWAFGRIGNQLNQQPNQEPTT